MWKKDFLLHGIYIWKTLWILTYVFNWLYFIQCLTSFFSIDHLLRLYTRFLILYYSNTDEFISINPSANVFFFGHFNVYHKDWLTYSGRSNRPGELFFNFFFISNGLNQIVNFPSRIPDCNSHSPALLDLFLSSDACICSTKVSLLWEVLVVVSVSIDFPSNWKRDAQFHHIAYDYSRAD